MKIPHIIALCGQPGSGKSEVQRILMRNHDVQSRSDAQPLRDFAISWFKLSWDDVKTQAGKSRYTEIAGAVIQNRKILGDLGKALESAFGPDIMPFMATKDLDPFYSYCFDSVRRGQAHFYRKLGGFVIGIRRSSVSVSPHDFDQFDESAVDFWIENNGSIGDLELSVASALRFANVNPQLTFVS